MDGRDRILLANFRTLAKEIKRLREGLEYMSNNVEMSGYESAAYAKQLLEED